MSVTNEVGNLTGQVDISLTESAQLELVFYLQDNVGSPLDISSFSAEFLIFTPPASSPVQILHLTSLDDPGSLSLSGNGITIKLTATEIDALAPPASDWTDAQHQLYIWPTADPTSRTRILAGRVTYSDSGL